MNQSSFSCTAVQTSKDVSTILLTLCSSLSSWSHQFLGLKIPFIFNPISISLFRVQKLFLNGTNVSYFILFVRFATEIRSRKYQNYKMHWILHLIAAKFCVLSENLTCIQTSTQSLSNLEISNFVFVQNENNKSRSPHLI